MSKEEIVKDIAQAKPKVEIIDFYNDIQTSMEHPVSRKSLERIGDNWLLDAYTNPETLHPSEYTDKCGLSWDSVMQFARRYDYFMDYYRKVKQVLGVRRERRMIEANPSKLEYILPQYLDEYREESERRSKLKATEQGEQKSHVTVILPDRKKDETRTS